MHALITGATGTVGRALRAHLDTAGHRWTAWDRAAVSIDSYHDMERFVRETAPDVLFHLAIASRPAGRENEQWLVNYQWPSELAWITRQLGIPFVFTSSVMVFASTQNGPFAPGDEPLAPDGYGALKRRAELRVHAQNPQARIARLGWQIGDAPGENTMIDFLHARMGQDGEVRASTLWYPACGLLQDTAAALAALAGLPEGLYQLDQNRGWSFFQIATALNEQRGRPWKIVPVEDYSQDQRMLDPRLALPSLRERLPGLPALES